MSRRTRLEADIREASARLERAEDSGDGAAIAHHTAEVDRLVAELEGLLSPVD